MSNRGARGTADWQQFEIVLSVPANTTNINFGVIHPGNGTAWFDSLAVEASGNVCVATLVSGCISVIAPDGTLVEQVPTGDRVTTNIAFGGPELKTAYITLSGKGELIAMDWPRPGLPLNFLNK